MGTSSKDKVVRFFDARTGTVASSIEGAHGGSKSMKLTYLGDSGKFLTVGASKISAREVKIWDLKNLDKPLHVEKIDNAAGVIMPLYDNDTDVLFLCGKGDGNIRNFEFEDKEPFIFRLNDFRSTDPTKGACLIPKRGCDVMNCETARLLKLNSKYVQPLSFTVPRKSDTFQEDLFPDCPAPDAAHTAEEWVAGSSKLPVKMSLNPAMRNDNKGGQKKKFTARTVASVSAELKEANERIKFLEDKLKENSIDF